MSQALSKRPSRELTREESGQDRPAFMPLTDIYESSEELMLESEMPGVDRAAIEVQVDGRRLSIRARRSSELGPEGGKNLWSEYGAGDYLREFEVGEAIDTQKISADYADGVLTLRLPKKEAARTRRISVQTRD